MLLLLSSSMKAQNAVSSTCVRYEKRHIVCTNDKGEMNIVDLDFEWPERLCDVPQPVLLQYINTLIGDSGTQLDEKMPAILSRYGKPLKNIQPGRNSSQSKEHQLELFVYDIPNQRILKGQELMKLNSILADPTASYYMSNALTDGLLSNYAISLDAQKLYGPVPVNDGTLLMEVGGDNQTTVQSMITTAQWVNFLTSKMKKLFNSKPVIGTPIMTQEDNNEAEDSMKVYRQTDVPASFSLNGQSLSQYISSNLLLPPYINKEVTSGRALVQLIIEKDGTVSHISIVKAVSPSLDRNIVAMLRQMPKWSPAMQNGKVVRSFYFIPVNVRLQ